MAIPADVPGSRLLPAYRAGHAIKRLPSRRWAMVTLAKRSREQLAAILQSRPHDKAACPT